MSLESQVILKGDDFGNQPDVNNGILALVKTGALTDVSVISTFSRPEDAEMLLEATRMSPLHQRGVRPGIVLHANFVSGSPLSDSSDVPTLVDTNGIFRRPPESTHRAWEEYVKTLNAAEVAREFDMQIYQFYELFDRLPDAFDAHNVSLYMPPLDDIAMKKAQELKIPITYPMKYSDDKGKGPFAQQEPMRDLHEQYQCAGIKTPDHIHTPFYNRFDTLEESVGQLLSVVSNLQPGVTQLFFHPGHPDFIQQATDPRFERGRVRDFQTLNDPRIRAVIDAVKLSSFRNLATS